MGRGPRNMNLESRLVPGIDTTSTRQCNVLSGVIFLISSHH